MTSNIPILGQEVSSHSNESNSQTLGDRVRLLIEACVSAHPSLGSALAQHQNNQTGGSPGQKNTLSSTPEDIEEMANSYFQKISMRISVFVWIWIFRSQNQHYCNFVPRNIMWDIFVWFSTTVLLCGKNYCKIIMRVLYLLPFEQRASLLSPIRGQMCELMQLRVGCTIVAPFSTLNQKLTTREECCSKGDLKPGTIEDK